jgi:hypothetical protein
MRVTILFASESAPASGDFFCYGNNAMLRHMQRTVEDSLGGDGDFFERFYSVWLVSRRPRAVDKFMRSERNAKCLDAQSSLTARIPEYRPLAIVSLLISIKTPVDAVRDTSGDLPLLSVRRQHIFLKKL